MSFSDILADYSGAIKCLESLKSDLNAQLQMYANAVSMIAVYSANAHSCLIEDCHSLNQRPKDCRAEPLSQVGSNALYQFPRRTVETQRAPDRNDLPMLTMIAQEIEFLEEKIADLESYISATMEKLESYKPISPKDGFAKFRYIVESEAFERNPETLWLLNVISECIWAMGILPEVY